MIALASHNPQVTQWVKAAAPGLFTQDAAQEEAKCYDFFEDDDIKGSLDDVRKKAEQGNASAQAALGTNYFWGRTSTQGNVTGRDYNQAEKWLLKASEQGKTKAQSLLARLYAEGGSGMYQNWTEADFWVVVAMQRERQQPENKGLPSCASQVLRKEVETHLSAAQQAEVSRRAEKWKPVVTPQLPAKPAPPPPAAAAAAPAAAIAAEPERGPCAGFSKGSEERLICEDRQKKIERSNALQAQRDKAFTHPASKTGEASADGKEPDEDKEAKDGDSKGAE